MAIKTHSLGLQAGKQSTRCLWPAIYNIDIVTYLNKLFTEREKYDRLLDS